MERIKGTHLVLPGNGDGSRVELGVERVIRRVQTDALDGRELLDIQHILGVDGVRIRNKRRLAHSGFQTAPVDASEQIVTYGQKILR